MEVKPNVEGSNPDANLRLGISRVQSQQIARLRTKEDKNQLTTALAALPALATDENHRLERLRKKPNNYSEGLGYLCSLATMPGEEDAVKQERVEAESLFMGLGARLYPALRVDQVIVQDLAREIQGNLANTQSLSQTIQNVKSSSDVDAALIEISKAMEGIIFTEDRSELLNEAAEKQLEILVRTAYVLFRLRDQLRESVKPSGPRRCPSEQIPAQAVETVREGVQEQILLQEILRVGASALHTSIPAEHSPKKDAGYQTQNSTKRLPKGISFRWDALAKLAQTMSEYRLEDGLRKHDLNEALALLPITEETFEVITVPGGFLKEATTKREMVGSKAVLHSALVSGGSNEPAVRFIYSAEDGNQRAYQDYSGRFGQVLWFELILPKSTGNKLMAAIRKNPALARRVVEALVLQDLRVDQKLWETGEGAGGHPLKPPYAQWASLTGASNMYIAPEGASSAGFAPKNVVQVPANRS